MIVRSRATCLSLAVLIAVFAPATAGAANKSAQAGGMAQNVPAPVPARRPEMQAARPISTSASDPEVITITLAGDTGYSPNHAPVSAKGVRRHGRFQTFADTTRDIAPLVDGDLNFLNVETVVTADNRLPRDTKGQTSPFSFRTHPQGLRHLVGIGFNVLSLANNHSMDYGAAGLEDTLRHVAALRKHGLLAAGGIGMNRAAASRPETIAVKGAEIAFSAIGIVTNNLARHRAGDNRPGQIAYRFDDDFKLTLDRLSAATADYRILSIHYGYEGRVRTDARQISEWRREAALGRGIDLVVGHHAHVPRGVELAGDSVIFYGLGNFLHHGTADMTAKGICRDYGLFARVHLARMGGAAGDAEGSGGRFVAQAIEVVPLTDTHMRPRPLPPAEAAKRVHALNYLGGLLGGGDGRAIGLRFTPQADGRGLYCRAGAEGAGASLARLCEGWKPAPSVPVSLRGRIAASCAR